MPRTASEVTTGGDMADDAQPGATVPRQLLGNVARPELLSPVPASAATLVIRDVGHVHGKQADFVHHYILGAGAEAHAGAAAQREQQSGRRLDEHCCRRAEQTARDAPGSSEHASSC